MGQGLSTPVEPAEARLLLAEAKKVLDTGGLTGASPALAALDYSFCDAVLASPHFAKPAALCEYLDGIAAAPRLQSTLRDYDDVVSVGILEPGGKENTIARLVQAIGSVSVPLASISRMEVRSYLLKRLGVALASRPVPSTEARVVSVAAAIAATASKPRPAVLTPGTTVCRGPDWRYDNADGGEGNVGTVVGMRAFDAELDKGVAVLWANATAPRTYRWGVGGKYDVAVVASDAPPAGLCLPQPWEVEMDTFCGLVAGTSSASSSPTSSGGWQQPLSRKQQKRRRRGPPRDGTGAVIDASLGTGTVSAVHAVLPDSARIANVTDALHAALEEQLGLLSEALEAPTRTVVASASSARCVALGRGIAALITALFVDVISVYSSKGSPADVSPVPASESKDGGESMDDDSVASEAHGLDSVPGLTPRVKAALESSLSIIQGACDVLERAAQAAVDIKEEVSVLPPSDREDAQITQFGSLEAVLRLSVVQSSLPLVVAALGTLPDIPAVSMLLLPSLVRLVQLVDSVAELMPEVQASEKRLLEFERSALEEPSSGSAVPRSHWLHDLVQSLCSLSGKCATSCVAGLPETQEEEGLGAWLKCAAMSGGLSPALSKMLCPEASSVSWATASTAVRSDSSRDVNTIAARFAEVEALGAKPLSATNTADLLRIVPSEDAVGTLLSCVMKNSPYSDPSQLTDVDTDTAVASSGIGFLYPIHTIVSSQNLVSAVDVSSYGAADRLLSWASGQSIDKLKHVSVEAESLFLAVLLKHGGLISEALNALSVNCTPPQAPSTTMSEAWKKFKTFVTYLSEQKLYEKQGYLADALSVGEIAPTDAAPMSSAQGEESKTGDGPTGTGVRRKPVRKAWEPVVDVPTSFDQVVSNVTLRCQLLMALAPAKHLAQSRLSAAPATSQLTQKWNDLLAPPTLAPLLMRWSSVGVPTGEDEDVDEDASRALLVGGTKSSPMSPETAAALFRNCVLYATRGANASPRVLLSVYRRRIMRAAQRSFGLAALLSLLKFASFSTARREALMHLRPGLRGKTAWLADTLSGGDRTSPDPSNIRHHYLKALEGVDAPALNGVQAAFIELYVHLGELLVQCSHFGDVGLGHVLSWNWAIDFEPQDHEFVLRVGIVPSLSKLFSMSQQAVVAQSLQRAGPRRDGTSASPPNGWSLWPLEYVRTALTSGTLTKWELVMHMQARGGVPPVSSEAAGEWWRSKQLHRSARTVANNHTIPSLIDLFVEFTARVAVTSTPEADSAAIIIQAAFRSYFVRNVLSKQESGDGSPLPSPLPRVVADGGSLPGRAGAVSRHFRVSSWSLLRVMIASAVGCRRRVRSSPAVPTTAGAGAAAPLEAQAGSAAQVSQLAAEAMQTVNESFPAGNADDSTVKYSRCLKMLGLDSIMEDLEFGVSVLTSLSMESLSLDGGSSTVDAAIPKTPSVKVLSPQKSTPPTGTPPLQASRSPAWGASPDLAPATVMLEWAEVEATAVSRLTFLASLRDVPALTQQLKTSRMISLCFRLLRIASPRLQRLSLLLLEAVLPSTAPNTADAAVLSAGLATPPSLREVNATVTALLQIVADASLPGSTQGVACPVGYGSGHVLLSLRAWTLSVLRALFIAPDWTAAVWKALELALNLVLPGVQSPASASQAPFALAIAACAVLGGVSEVLRVGARVVTTQVLAEAGLSGNSVLASQWAGTVVRYSRSAALASVVYDPTAPLSDVEASDLVPIDALPLPVACAILPGPVMLALSAILSVTMPDLPAPQEDAVTPDPEGDVGDAKKGPKAASVKDSAAAASVPKNDDTVPMQDLAADVDNFRLWITALQKHALLCLEKCVEHAGNLTLAARSGLFPIVLRLALKRVRLPSLLLPRYLSDRGNLLLERLLEWSLGISCGGFDVQTQRAEKVVSEAELILRSKAADLSGMGYDFDLCLKGLQLKGGNVELTAEWLLSGEGEVYRQGGGLEEMKIEEKENPRLVQARELGLICGRPPKLCAHALEIFNDNGDAALMWLFDRGIDFLPGLNVGDPEPGSYTGFGAGADADAASRGGADDAAVLNDLDLGEAGVDFEDDFVSGAAVSAQPPAPEPIVRSGSGSSRVSFSSDGEGGGEVDPLLARLEMLRRGDGPPSAAGGVGEVIDLASLSEAEMTEVVHQALAHSSEFMSEIIQAAHRSTRTISAATIGQAAASIGLVGVRAPSGLVRFERRSAVPTPAPPRAAATGSKGKKGDAPLQAPGVSADSRRGLPEVSFRKLNAASPAALFSSGDGPRLKNRIVSTVTNMANMWRICIPTGLLVIPSSSSRSDMVRLEVLEEETGLVRHESCSLSSIALHSHLFGVPISSFDHLRALAAFTDGALSTLAARRVVTAMLTSLPPTSSPSSPLPPLLLTPSESSGNTISVPDMIQLMKLVAASEDVFGSGKVSTGAAVTSGPDGFPRLAAGAPLMGALQLRMKSFLLADPSGGVGVSMAFLSSILVDEVASNMLASTHPVLDDGPSASKKVMRESLHPHYHNVSQAMDEVKCEGARALWVTFDPRSCVHSRASLSFYTDKTFRQPVMTCSGDGSNFRPFVVHGDTVYVKFRASNDDGDSSWGYRFHVSPMEGLQWLSEKQVLEDPSLEWACWVLEFLLRDAQELVDKGALHNARVFNAMVQYLRARGTPFKHRVISLLTQLLKSPSLFPRDQLPDIALLRGIERCVMEFCQAKMAQQQISAVFPPRVLQLVELLTTARAAEKALRAPAGVPMLSTAISTNGSLVPPPVLSQPPKESKESVMKLPLQDVLQDVMELTECVYSNSRLPDAVVCRMLLDATSDPSSVTVTAVSDAVRMMMDWTADMDSQLVQWVTSLTSPRRREEAKRAALASGMTGPAVMSTVTAQSPLELAPADVTPTEEDQIVFQRLPGSILSIRLRFALIRLLNLRLYRVVPLLDVMNSSDVYSLGFKLRSLNHCVLIDIKANFLQCAVDNTWRPQESGMTASLDNIVAMTSNDKAARDPAERSISVSQCMFVQVFKQIAHQPANLFRSQHERLFKVSFVDERGIDAGGLFRDTMSLIVDDMLSPHLDLFLLCPNGRFAQGVNTEKYVPNPRHTSPQALSMFEFAGRLMGFVLRHKFYLPFELPPMVWELLVGQKPRRDLLQLHDLQSSTRLQSLSASASLSPEEFDAKFNSDGSFAFTFPGSDGLPVELIAGGNERRVTVSNVKEYVNLAYDMRLKEFDAASTALRRGLMSVVPERALKLLTWRELEVLVCGDPEVDPDVLQAKATYQGWDADAVGVQRFWRVFRELSNDDRSKFIRFAWGRARLPKLEHWTVPFKITRHGGGDTAMPIAHTCFFQIELPEYSSDDIMRSRLLAAVHYGMGGFLIA